MSFRPYMLVVLSSTLALAAIAASGPGDLSANPPRWTASPVDTTIWKSYRWRSVGPDRGGRSIAISGVKGQPKVGYFGATGGGLWKTTDGGETWAPVTDGQITSASVGAVAVSEIESRHRLHRHGRVVHSRRHHARRRRLQVDRRRQDVDARRIREL